MGIKYILDGAQVRTKKGELKPCPFCGGKAVLQRDTRYPRPARSPRRAYEALCVNRACIIYKADNTYFLAKRDAINAWNRRFGDDKHL